MIWVEMALGFCLLMLTPPVTPPRYKTQQQVRDEQVSLNPYIVGGALLVSIISVLYWGWITWNLSIGTLY